jgi:hypothetical protein
MAIPALAAADKPDESGSDGTAINGINHSINPHIQCHQTNTQTINITNGNPYL